MFEVAVTCSPVLLLEAFDGFVVTSSSFGFVLLPLIDDKYSDSFNV